MKRRLATLALALLFLLPACSRQNQPEPYKWVPPEKKVTQTAAEDGYDSMSGMTYEEYLTTIDEPIVLSYERILISTPVSDYEMVREPLVSSLRTLRSAPHVTDISFPTLLHWLDNFCGEQIIQFPEEYVDQIHDSIDVENIRFAPMEKATLMIGQYQSALREEQIGEGRKWTDMTECCVNRALYEKLLADEAMEFSGLGDSITVTETCYRQGINPESKKDAIGVHHNLVITKHEYTVVGIVEDEGEYADTDAYGFFHIYAPLDMVKNLTAKHDYNHPSYVDEAMYRPTELVRQYRNNGTTWLFTRPSPDDPSKMEIRLPDNQIVTEEEWLARFANMPINAGYTMEVTLDSGTGFAEFMEYIQTIDQDYTAYTARYYYEGSFEIYERNKASHPDDPTVKLNIAPLVQEIADADELDEWYYYPLVPRVIRPLRVAGAEPRPARANLQRRCRTTHVNC